MPIQTRYGLIEGVQQDDILVYKGIPYAKAPIGELRWKAPQEADPWEDVFHADHFGNRCLQRPHQPGSFYYKEFAYGEPSTPYSEDCLYLNIWTPAQPGEKCPVAIFIHGGAFLCGYGHEAEFDGTAYARKGVILVTINYRLGVWGYLAHPWLREENPNHTSGNYGMLDQIAALQWVRENIAAFGGDPENITVFGQSAGAISTLVLACSPLTKGMFAKAIIQSGMGLNCDFPSAQAEADGEEFMANAKVKSLAELRNADPEIITQAAAPIIMRGLQSGKVLSFEPNLDGWLLTDTFDNLIAQGKLHDIPYIVGSNKNDMRTDPAAVAAGDKGPMYAAEEKFAAAVSAAQKNKVYAYYFTHQPPGDDAGAFHSAELWYTMGTLDRCWRPMTEADYALSEKMVTAWTDFMKSGTPGWQEYTREAPHIQVLDSESKMVFA